MKAITMQADKIEKGKDSRFELLEQDWEIVAVNTQSLNLQCEKGSGIAWIQFNGGRGHYLVDFLSFELLATHTPTSVKIGAKTKFFSNMVPTLSSGSVADTNNGEIAEQELVLSRIYEFDKLKDFPLYITPNEKLEFPYTVATSTVAPNDHAHVKAICRVLSIVPTSSKKIIKFKDTDVNLKDTIGLFKNQRKDDADYMEPYEKPTQEAGSFEEFLEEDSKEGDLF
ncbi:hypothetical protein [Candidatus Lokiarchaeum ossiferum]|uniref:hypothetical protein n=1 Tax=Candidatus Lokiarchaeum ossiferum TaxID=2951803 RepID=UPI00352FE6DC